MKKCIQALTLGSILTVLTACGAVHTASDTLTPMSQKTGTILINAKTETEITSKTAQFKTKDSQIKHAQTAVITCTKGTRTVTQTVTVSNKQIQASLNLLVGQWTVRLDVKDESDYIIYTGTTQVTVVEDNPTPVDIQLAMVKGTLILNIDNMNPGSAINWIHVFADPIPNDGGSQSISQVLSNAGTSSSTMLPLHPGVWFIQLEGLDNNQTKVQSASMMVTIAENVTQTLTAVFVDINGNVSINLNLTPMEVTGINLSAPSAALSLTGQTSTTLTATIIPDTAYQGVVYASLNRNIVTVDQTGKITAVGAGTTTVKVFSQDNNTVWAECAITVNP